MSLVFTEPMRAGEHLVSEVGTQSREVGIIATGPTANYMAGTVLGQNNTTNKFYILAPTATDGTQNAVAVLYSRVDATSVDQQAVINVRLTEVNGLCLTWPSGITGSQQTAAIAQLASAGIEVRT